LRGHKPSIAGWIGGVLALLAAPQLASAQGPVAADLARSAQRGAGYLVRAGLEWQQAHNCVACHVHGDGLEALSRAAARGYAVDTPDVAPLIDAAAQSVPADGYIQNDYGPLDAAAYIGAGLAAAHRQFQSAVVEPAVLLANQVFNLRHLEDDGVYWEPESRRGPMLTGTYLVSSKCTDVLQLAYDAKSLGGYAETRYQASIWAVRTPAPDTVSAAVRLEWLCRSQSPSLKARREELIASLTAQQGADGGWGYKPEEASNAFATAVVLRSLARAGTPLSSPIAQKAAAYLASTQQPDGSWACGSPILSYSATAWAVRAFADLIEAPAEIRTELASLYAAAKAGQATGPTPSAPVVAAAPGGSGVAPTAPEATGGSPPSGVTSALLPNPPVLQWGISGETTLAGSFGAALKYLGGTEDYAQVMGTSGGAFAVRWPVEGVQISAGTLQGEPHVRGLLAGLGRTGAYAGSADAAARWATLKSAIDAGRPCVFLKANGEHGLLMGYDEKTMEVVAILYGDSAEVEPQRLKADELDYVVDPGPPPPAPPDPIDSLREVITNAARNAAQPPAGGLAHGPAAYEAWAKYLTSLPADGALPEDLVPAVKWCVDVLIDSRIQASAFLRRAAKDVPSGSAVFLIRAASEYDRLVQLLNRREFYLYSVEEGKKPASEVLATAEGRQAFAGLLTECRDADAAAMDELKMALRGLGRAPVISSAAPPSG